MNQNTARETKPVKKLEPGMLAVTSLLPIISGFLHLTTRTERYAYGSLVGDHISNFFGTSTAMFSAITVINLFEQYLDYEEVRALAPYVKGVVVMVLIWMNLNFEVWDGNTQMNGDMLSSLIALFAGWIAVEASFKKVDLVDE